MEDKDRKDKIIKQVTDIEFKPTEIELSSIEKKVAKVPLDKIANYGTNMAMVASTLSSVVKSASATGGILYRATDAAGNAVKLTQAFNDGSGLLGSVTDAVNGFQQFRFHEVAGAGQVASAINPVLIVAAAAIVQINMKLDAIQDTQKAMFDYLKAQDHAKQMGDLRQLAEVLNDYKYNWENENYRNDKVQLVQDIKRSAEQKIIQYHDLIEKEIAKESFLHLRKDAKEKAEKAAEYLREYQIAIYLYSFSTFLEKILNGNFQKEAIDATVQRILERSNEYHVLCDKCQEQIKSETDTTIETGILTGLSVATNFLGKAVEKTQIGDNTQIDEALIGAGKGIGNFNKEQIDNVRNLLVDPSDNISQPFVDSLNETSRLYNSDLELLTDGEDVYLLSDK